MWGEWLKTFDQPPFRNATARTLRALRKEMIHLALPTAPSFASFDVTARTEGRSVNDTLFDAMFAKSRLMDIVGLGPKIKQQRHEWISLAAPAQYVTAAATTTTIDGSASLDHLGLSDADYAKVQPGTLLVNTSVATPIGTYLRNEILQVTEMHDATSGSSIVLVARDIGNFNSGTGSTLHAEGHVFRILYTPLQEGSVASADPNQYSADTILENYSAIQSMKLQLTGSQAARDMEVVAKELERQYQRELVSLKNKMSSMIVYGFNSATAVGSDTVIRNCKGIQDFLVDNIVAANPLVDYATTTLGYDAIDNLFLKLWNNGADPSDNLKIVTSGVSKQVIGSWDADKVRTTINEGQVGREITVFKSTLGFEAEVIADPIIDKNNLFIINPNKISLIPFRPFEKEAWGKGTSSPNGDDVYYQRTLGEFTLEVLDPGYGHAAITYLTWV